MITYADFIALQNLISNTAIHVFRDKLNGLYCYRMPDNSKYVFDFDYKCVLFYTPKAYRVSHVLVVK